MSKLSPGPWKWDRDDNLRGASDQLVAFGAGHDADGICVMNDADAAAIAKVPEMVERITKLEALLRKHMWNQCSECYREDPYFCIECLEDQPNHKPGCALDTLLKALP